MKTFKTFPETDCPRANALVVEPFCLGDFFIMETEIWKDVEGFEGLYQVSNFGMVKSLARFFIGGNGSIIQKKDTFIKFGKDTSGYYQIALYKNGKVKRVKVHRLVYETFIGKTNLQIDHIIEGNKLDNRIENLQPVTNRENISKHKLTKNKSSQYTGVCLNKKTNRWGARIYMNGKYKHIGYFSTEIEAAQAYQDKLNTL